MKNQFITIGVAVMMALGLTSCTKDEVKPQSVGQTYSNDPNTKLSGDWVVSSFKINGAEHSDFYTPYILTFKDADVVAATGSGKEIQGKWSMDVVEDHQRLSLDFGDVDPLNLLNNTNWEVESRTGTLITMKGTRGDDGTESLVLKRR